MPTQKKITLKAAAFGLLIVAMPSAALLRVAQTHQAFLVLSHYLQGRAGPCTLRESFESAALSRLQLANVSEVQAASRRCADVVRLLGEAEERWLAVQSELEAIGEP